MSQYVKFTYQRTRADIAPFVALAELNACRRKLLDQHLMGVYANGVGFGNVSVRDGATGNFYVTGSATGGFAQTDGYGLRASRRLGFQEELAAI